MNDLPHSPAAERNRQPILDALLQVLPTSGTALEIASGTGQHVTWFAAGLPHWVWQPTDWQAADLAPIAARVAQERLTNVRPPVLLDVMAPQWLVDSLAHEGYHFDQSLRAQNPVWGIRKREDVETEAARAGLQLSARHVMPANNLLLVWQRKG